MSSLKFLCEKYFGTNNFYNILKVKPNASEKVIKRAYHKLSLLVHPDRVEQAQKEVATEKFKVLGKIHSILQDGEKRRFYDEYGELDEFMDLTYNWLGYWLSMFKKIDIGDVKKYEREYLGSETERRDIKRAYEISRGNMDTILEMVPFSNCDSEPRITRIVRRMVENGEVEWYKAFFNESKSKKAKRRKRWEQEQRETESISMKEIEEEMDRNMRLRARKFEKLFADIRKKYCSRKRNKCILHGTIQKMARKKR
ncbi:hypothetical protein NQ318_010944 [Aromia moschata]|uniref:J domain-containing protein n=1 Tax=Aromia moschata TaxID=1265417 RepID=A0AAV8XHB8_9CUCU|nr:hypothetical protein NQ318_010944 [Aromia moschata]